MRLKKGILTLIAMVVVLGAIVSPAISTKAEALGSHGHVLISPLYIYTNSIGVNLFFEGNTAQCSGFVFPSGSYNVSATLTLYKQIVSGWQYVSSWSGSATDGLPVSITGAATVSSGTYKLVIRGNVSNLEYPTASTIKTK